MKPYEIVKIQYTKMDSDETTERTIIPTFVPSDAMKAIDVSGLAEDERSELLGLLQEYSDYYQLAAKRIYSFEDWISHTTGLSEDARPTVKWRTFLLSNTEFID